ncbi:MAG: (Fe-S)-binding protein [Balneolales bacterium]
MRISLFITCFNDMLYPETGKAVVRLLERLGHEVEFLPDQTCCGQMHFNSGYHSESLPLARRFVQTFEDAEVIVSPSASCVGMVRDSYSSLADQAGDKDFKSQIDKITPRIFELSEFLVNKLGVTDVGAYYPHKVTYHPTCHSLRMLKVGDAPLKLLRAVRGIELIELEAAEECCGFGGTFAVKNADTSMAMLGDKIRHISNTGARVCTSGDNSCLMNIGGGLQRQNAGIETVHLAEILASTEND